MCRNIRTLFNFDPAATDEEVRAASLQFVRKITGFNRPSQANQAAFEAAVDDVARAWAQAEGMAHATGLSELVQRLADLAARATDGGDTLYLWVG